MDLLEVMRPKHTFFLLLYFFFASSALATHLRCGQIVVRQMAPGSTTVRITVEVFLNTFETNVEFGGEADWLDLGDGTRMLVPEQPHLVRYDLNPDATVAYAYFAILHTYPALEYYTISYSEPNRNAGVINYASSVNTAFYIESGFLLMTDRAYQTPVPLLPPIFHGFVEDDFSASVAAVDSNNFALLYSLEVPLMAKNTPVSNYQKSGSAFLNPVTGLLTWDCKFKGENVLGEFLYAVKIGQYDTSEAPWKKIGYVYRDFQVIVSDASGVKGVLADNGQDEQNIVELPENTSGSLKVFVYPGAEEEVELTLKTELAEEFYTFDVYDSLHDNQEIVVGKLQLTHEPSMAKIVPYIISIRVSFTHNSNQTYFKDTNFAFVTKEFIPAFGPIDGIEEDRETFFISPNPFCDFVSVNYPTAVPLTLAVYNSIGQLVFITETDYQRQIDLSRLPSGIYFIKSVLPGGKVFASAKLVKE